MTVNKAESNANNYINNNKQVENKEKTTNQAKQVNNCKQEQKSTVLIMTQCKQVHKQMQTIIQARQTGIINLLKQQKANKNKQQQ